MKEGFTFIEASLKLPFKRKFTFRNFGGGGELQKRPSSNSKKKTKNSMRNKTRMIHTDRNNIGGIELKMLISIFNSIPPILFLSV